MREYEKTEGEGEERESERKHDAVLNCPCLDFGSPESGPCCESDCSYKTSGQCEDETECKQASQCEYPFFLDCEFYISFFFPNHQPVLLGGLSVAFV